MDLEVLPRELWADAVATTWIGLLRRQPSLRMCLPTGSTPAPVYDRMVAAHRAGEVSFADATVFLLDEFGLPAGDPARCDGMLRSALLDHVDLRPERFDRLDVDAADLDAECVRFQTEVERGGLDLVILGLGTNGHLGLNEPGSAARSPTRRVELAPSTRDGATDYGAERAPTWGLTLGLGPILDAREVWLLVTGAHKAAILGEVVHGPVSSEVPASFLRTHPRVLVAVDDPAAAQVQVSPVD